MENLNDQNKISWNLLKFYDDPILKYPVPLDTAKNSLLYEHLIYESSSLSALFLQDMDTSRAQIKRELINFEGNKSAAFIGTDGILSLTKKCFEQWYTLARICENNREIYKINGLLIFSWKVSKEEYTNTCFRFETIGWGLLYGIILFNRSMNERSNKIVGYKQHLIHAYTIFRYVCYEEIKTWKRRDELKLPFIFTERGILSLITLSLIQLQMSIIYEIIEIDESDNNASDEKKNISRLARWIQIEIQYLDRQIDSRVNDGTLNELPWENKNKFFIKDYIFLSNIFFLIGIFFYFPKKLSHENIVRKISLSNLIIENFGNLMKQKNYPSNIVELFRKNFQDRNKQHKINLTIILDEGQSNLKNTDIENVQEMLKLFEIKPVFDDERLFEEVQKFISELNKSEQINIKNIRFM